MGGQLVIGQRRTADLDRNRFAGGTASSKAVPLCLAPFRSIIINRYVDSVYLCIRHRLYLSLMLGLSVFLSLLCVSCLLPKHV